MICPYFPQPKRSQARHVPIVSHGGPSERGTALMHMPPIRPSEMIIEIDLSDAERKRLALTELRVSRELVAG